MRWGRGGEGKGEKVDGEEGGWGGGGSGKRDGEEVEWKWEEVKRVRRVERVGVGVGWEMNGGDNESIIYKEVVSEMV